VARAVSIAITAELMRVTIRDGEQTLTAIRGGILVRSEGIPFRNTLVPATLVFLAVAVVVYAVALLRCTMIDVRIERLAIACVFITVVVVVHVRTISQAVGVRVRVSFIDLTVAVVVHAVTDFHASREPIRSAHKSESVIRAFPVASRKRVASVRIGRRIAQIAQFGEILIEHSVAVVILAITLLRLPWEYRGIAGSAIDFVLAEVVVIVAVAGITRTITIAVFLVWIEGERAAVLGTRNPVAIKIVCHIPFPALRIPAVRVAVAGGFSDSALSITAGGADGARTTGAIELRCRYVVHAVADT